MLRYYDTHAHYGNFAFSSHKKYQKFCGNAYQNLVNAKEMGVLKIVNAAIEMNSNEMMLKLFSNTTQIIPEIRFALGEHPNSVGTEEERYLDKEKDRLLEQLLQKANVCAVKTGLDFYRCEELRTRQIERFRHRIQQSKKQGLPLMLHVRDAHQETLKVLKEVSEGRKYQGVVHCFTEEPAIAWEYVKLGFYIGIGGKITQPKFEGLQKTVEEVPLEWIMLETDAPFIPLYKSSIGGSSCDIPKIAEKISEIKKINLDIVAEKTYQNAEKVFG